MRNHYGFLLSKPKTTCDLFLYFATWILVIHLHSNEFAQNYNNSTNHSTISLDSPHLVLFSTHGNILSYFMAHATFNGSYILDWSQKYVHICGQNHKYYMLASIKIVDTQVLIYGSRTILILMHSILNHNNNFVSFSSPFSTSALYLSKERPFFFVALSEH